MSKYSFIEAELNIPGKQCFCVDINNSNTPFTYATQINYLLNPVSSSTPVPTSVAEPVSSSTPVPTSVSEPVSIAPVSVENDTYDTKSVKFSIDTPYLLSPDAKQNSNDRQTQIINTVNNLLTTAVNDIANQSNTVNDFKEDEEEVDDFKSNRGNKKYKLKSKSMNLLENFEQDKCNNTCSIKKHRKKNKKSSSDMIMLLLLLIVIGYLFYNKKQ